MLIRIYLKRLSVCQKLGGPLHTTIYIGKGTKERAFNLRRNQARGIKLKQAISNGHQRDEIVGIIKANLTELEALELEAKLIYFFGTVYEKYRAGILLNWGLSLRPEFSVAMEKLGKESTK
jgi:hypothetical protein